MAMRTVDIRRRGLRFRSDLEEHGRSDVGEIRAAAVGVFRRLRGVVFGATLAKQWPMTAPLRGRRERSPIPDLDRCAQEQVQVIGQIQPHGLLFRALRAGSDRAAGQRQISTILGLPPESVLDRSFEAVLGAQLFERFKLQTAERCGTRCNPVSFAGKGRQRCNAMHRSPPRWLADRGVRVCRGSAFLDTLDFESHIRLPLSRMRPSPIFPSCRRWQRAKCEAERLRPCHGVSIR